MIFRNLFEDMHGEYRTTCSENARQAVDNYDENAQRTQIQLAEQTHGKY